MSFVQGTASLIAAAIAGLMPMATAMAASAASVQGAAHRTKGCMTVTATIPTGHAAIGIAANPKTNIIYTANTIDDTVSVINGRTNTVTATIRVGQFPDGIAADPKTDIIYVTTRRTTRCR
jgi:YVTN family beta-propeller protein